MKQLKIQLAALVLSAVLAACATTGGAVSLYTKVNDGVLVGSNNMTLYTFDKDVSGSGKSSCNDQCAANWPPLIVDGSQPVTGDYSVITREDGKKQLAYKGKPLYYWAKDAKPGDKFGDGFLNGAWHIVKI